jgi:hypothetical protein
MYRIDKSIKEQADPLSKWRTAYLSGGFCMYRHNRSITELSLMALVHMVAAWRKWHRVVRCQGCRTCRIDRSMKEEVELLRK